MLLPYPVDLKNPGQPVLANEKSVVLSLEGVVLATSTHNIVYRFGFFGDPNEPQTLSGGYNRGHEDSIFGPAPNGKVYVAQSPSSFSLLRSDLKVDAGMGR